MKLSEIDKALLRDTRERQKQEAKERGVPMQRPGRGMVGKKRILKKVKVGI